MKYVTHIIIIFQWKFSVVFTKNRHTIKSLTLQGIIDWFKVKTWNIISSFHDISEKESTSHENLK